MLRPPAPSSLRWLSIVAYSGLFLSGGGVAQAQILHNDFTRQSSQYNSSSASTVLISPDAFGSTMSQKYDDNGKPVSSSWFIGNSAHLGEMKSFTGGLPGINNHVNDSRATMPANTFNNHLSNLNGKMTDSPMWQDSFPKGRDFPTKMAPSPNQRLPQMQSSMQRDSSLNDYTSFDRWKDHKTGPDKFTDAYTFHTAADQGPQLEQVGKELSLQDLNRYQFQGSFSSDPGLPITHAAGDLDQVHTDGGSLVNQPRLFNFSIKPSGQIRSGGEVAPNVITSNGKHPYLPKAPRDEGPAPDFSAAANGNKVSALPTASAGLIPAGTYETKTPGGPNMSIQLSAPQVFVGGDAEIAPDAK